MAWKQKDTARNITAAAPVRRSTQHQPQTGDAGGRVEEVIHAVGLDRNSPRSQAEETSDVFSVREDFRPQAESSTASSHLHIDQVSYDVSVDQDSFNIHGGYSDNSHSRQLADSSIYAGRHQRYKMDELDSTEELEDDDNEEDGDDIDSDIDEDLEEVEDESEEEFNPRTYEYDATDKDFDTQPTVDSGRRHVTFAKIIQMRHVYEVDEGTNLKGLVVSLTDCEVRLSELDLSKEEESYVSPDQDVTVLRRTTRTPSPAKSCYPTTVMGIEAPTRRSLELQGPSKSRSAQDISNDNTPRPNRQSKRASPHKPLPRSEEPSDPEFTVIVSDSEFSPDPFSHPKLPKLPKSKSKAKTVTQSKKKPNTKPPQAPKAPKALKDTFKHAPSTPHNVKNTRTAAQTSRTHTRQKLSVTSVIPALQPLPSPLARLRAGSRLAKEDPHTSEDVHKFLKVDLSNNDQQQCLFCLHANEKTRTSKLRLMVIRQ
ncbi:hypothetical protein PQX77_002812 [Marasmius sp. AFHP31]|nr:hypothetical protein PQX77_002812 [Marasmius sp. AFHP31]